MGRFSTGVMSHEPKLALLTRNVQFDRTNNGVRTSQGLKAKLDGSSGSSADICRLQCSPRANPILIGCNVTGSGDHAKSYPQKGGVIMATLARCIRWHLMAVTSKPQGLGLTSHALKQGRSTYQRLIAVLIVNVSSLLIQLRFLNFECDSSTLLRGSVEQRGHGGPTMPLEASS
jgi:hypothetical protein